MPINTETNDYEPITRARARRLDKKFAGPLGWPYVKTPLPIRFSNPDEECKPTKEFPGGCGFEMLSPLDKYGSRSKSSPALNFGIYVCENHPLESPFLFDDRFTIKTFGALAALSWTPNNRSTSTPSSWKGRWTFDTTGRYLTTSRCFVSDESNQYQPTRANFLNRITGYPSNTWTAEPESITEDAGAVSACGSCGRAAQKGERKTLTVQSIHYQHTRNLGLNKFILTAQVEKFIKKQLKGWMPEISSDLYEWHAYHLDRHYEDFFKASVAWYGRQVDLSKDVSREGRHQTIRDMYKKVSPK